MTDEDWAARLRAFDRQREAHARTLDAFRVQLDAARRMLRRVIWRMEREPCAPGTWSARAQRAGPRRRAGPADRLPHLPCREP
jgi:hypothetical protein